MPETADLTVRYVAAVVRAVPESSRSDVAAELASSIRDQVDGRVEHGEPFPDAERAVLTELGDPLALAAGYSGRGLALIGPRYYLDWLRLLKVLLVVIVPIVAVVIFFATALPDSDFGGAIGATVSGAIQVAVHIVFWTTLAFALLERYGTESPVTEWSPERLPALQPKGAGFSDILSMILSSVAALVALAWDQLVGFVRIDGQRTAMLTDDPVVLAVLALFLAVPVVIPFMVYRARRWTPRLAYVNAVIGVVGGVVLLWLIAEGLILSAPATEWLRENDATDGVAVGSVVGIVLSIGWSVWDAFRRARA